VNKSPIFPDKCGVILNKLSLYSLSTERPNAKEITLFLPNKNLIFLEKKILKLNLKYNFFNNFTCYLTIVVLDPLETNYVD
jgi:hypothetical protein